MCTLRHWSRSYCRQLPREDQHAQRVLWGTTPSPPEATSRPVGPRSRAQDGRHRLLFAPRLGVVPGSRTSVHRCPLGEASNDEPLLSNLWAPGPPLSLASRSAPSSTSRCATSGWPHLAAQCRGVPPRRGGKKTTPVAERAAVRHGGAVENVRLQCGGQGFGS